MGMGSSLGFPVWRRVRVWPSLWSLSQQRSDRKRGGGGIPVGDVGAKLQCWSWSSFTINASKARKNGLMYRTHAIQPGNICPCTMSGSKEKKKSKTRDANSTPAPKDGATIAVVDVAVRETVSGYAHIPELNEMPAAIILNSTRTQRNHMKWDGSSCVGWLEAWGEGRM